MSDSGSFVAADLAGAGPSEAAAHAGPAGTAAAAPGGPTTGQRLPAWIQQRTLVDPAPCSPAHDLVDVTTNATTAGTSVALADTGPPVAAGQTTDECPTTRAARLA